MPDQTTTPDTIGTHPVLHTEAFWPDRFAGQVFLVTGAAGGLGSATARRLAQEGARVMCTDVRSGGAGDGSSPENCLALNVTKREDWDQAISIHGRSPHWPPGFSPPRPPT
ncbi:SDR family NAD(P)-dependent oxidoreductase [Saccharopolyspora hattusasensis]|uniref:SDR family NAD(P)-dependent oxidoreductase n=1 Tax=Saccharopolyspora hattusasensis TaxID=1128679 RepID=UPI003D9533DF